MRWTDCREAIDAILGLLSGGPLDEEISDAPMDEDLGLIDEDGDPMDLTW